MEKTFIPKLNAQLTGSEKQVAWAEKIRGGVEVDLIIVLNRLNKVFTAINPETAAHNTENTKAWLEQAFNARTDARFWIDSRDTSAEDLVYGLGDNGRKIMTMANKRISK